MEVVKKERRGFASMPTAKQREIASKGGRAAHEKGVAHEWTVDEARNAGRKGGAASWASRRARQAAAAREQQSVPGSHDDSSRRLEG